MDRNIQKNGLLNLFLLLTAGVAGFAVSDYGHALAGQMAVFFIGLGLLVAAVSWFQMRLEDRERLEKLEFDEISKAGGSTTLFNTQEAESFPARRSREQFEKYFVPGFTVLLFLLQAAGFWWLWGRLPKLPAPPVEHPLVVMALLSLFALLLFLIGKYTAGLARLEHQRLLRPGASYLLLSSYLFALAVLAVIAVEAGFPEVDLYVARGLCGLLALLALETVIGLVLEIYRPRVKGKQGLLLYESRLVGLLSHPEGLFTTAAHALDYQFGFKVSDTWFYRFLQKALAWLLLAQLGILLLSTCFVFIETGEEALLERFGQPIQGRGVIGPGLHLKLPWPIDRAHRFRTREIQTFHVGLAHEEEEKHEESTVLWTVSHAKEEFHLLVASREQAQSTNTLSGRKSPPVNLLTVSIPVQFQITNLTAWAYNYKDAGQLLERVATREVVRYLVNVDLNEVMSIRRFEAAEELQRRIQTRANELNLGAKILLLSLSDIHPPVQVAASYEEVVGARQKREANILDAEAYRAKTNALSSAAAVRKIRESEAASHRVKVTTLGKAELFTNQIQAYQASPSVYQQRARLQTLVRDGGRLRKVILATTNTHNNFYLNLEDKIGIDYGDIMQPKAKP